MTIDFLIKVSKPSFRSPCRWEMARKMAFLRILHTKQQSWSYRAETDPRTRPLAQRGHTYPFSETDVLRVTGDRYFSYSVLIF